jgi:aryl-alcohol dehydrogenase-like predicted oxidoreductase
MTFGKEADEKTSIAIMDRAAELGINFFDTANIYNNGESERIVGRWLKDRRDDYILATKGHFPTGEGLNDRGSSRRHLFMTLDQSLKRLQTDWVDILYLHHWDEHTDLCQTMDALTNLVDQGKVHYIGVSNFSGWQTMKALSLGKERGFAPIVCVQPMYNLVKRQAEVEILPLAQEESLAVMPYNPLAAGLLTGKYQRNEPGRLIESDMYRDRYKNRQYWEIAERFVQYATMKQMSPAALAMAWVATNPAVTAPILGARSVAQLDETMQCLDIGLTPEDRAKITELSIDPPLATDR